MFIVWTTTIIICSYNNLKVNWFATVTQPDFNLLYYERPWIKADIVIFGLIIGCIYKEFKSENKY